MNTIEYPFRLPTWSPSSPFAKDLGNLAEAIHNFDNGLASCLNKLDSIMAKVELIIPRKDIPPSQTTNSLGLPSSFASRNNLDKDGFALPEHPFTKRKRLDKTQSQETAKKKRSNQEKISEQTSEQEGRILNFEKGCHINSLIQFCHESIQKIQCLGGRIVCSTSAHLYLFSMEEAAWKCLNPDTENKEQITVADLALSESYLIIAYAQPKVLMIYDKMGIEPLKSIGIFNAPIAKILTDQHKLLVSDTEGSWHKNDNIDGDCHFRTSWETVTSHRGPVTAFAIDDQLIFTAFTNGSIYCKKGLLEMEFAKIGGIAGTLALNKTFICATCIDKEGTAYFLDIKDGTTLFVHKFGQEIAGVVSDETGFYIAVSNKIHYISNVQKHWVIETASIFDETATFNCQIAALAKSENQLILGTKDGWVISLSNI